MIIGGRDSYSYELMPPQVDFKPTVINTPFLQQTTEPAVGQGLHIENNLYPFTLFILDGNVFIFANDCAILYLSQELERRCRNIMCYKVVLATTRLRARQLFCH
ncbi:putative glyoxal oxidase [Helianthus anomalus]